MHNKEELENLLKNIRKKLFLELDQIELIRQISELSSNISKLRKEKEYFESAIKLLDVVYDNYNDDLEKWMLKSLNTQKKELSEDLKDVMTQIVVKNERLENYKLILDFMSYDSFDKVIEIRNKKIN